MNDKEFCDQVHMNIHAIRLLSKYTPSEMDKKISKLVIDKYSNSCNECKEVGERNKNVQPKKGFFDKIGEVIN